MFYSDDLIEEIRSRNDILDVVGSYVKLKRSGSVYMGLCPFHNEKSPSFSVTPGKQMYHCFGCGEGGDVFSFIMKYENYTFMEALKMLADRAGVDLPEMEYSAEEKQRADLKATLLEINKKTATYFYKVLLSDRGAVGREYFHKRGLEQDTILRFGLGYSGKGGSELYQYLKKQGYSDEVLKESGLFTFSSKGTYDKFWNRVMFPILDVNNRVIGFGGRVMGEGEPKYLNSPETKIFEKSKNLYGLNYAKISRKNYLLICEGYMDVIALHTAGFTNAVAALGTAFTSQHAMLIKRYVKEVVLTFDSDEAGRKAALRAIPMLKQAGIGIKVLNMSPYKDPDEFIKNNGAEEYQKRIDEAKDSFLFEIEMMQRQYDMNEPHQKSEFYLGVARKLLEFQTELERNVYVEAVAREFMIPQDELAREVVNQALSYKPEKEKKISIQAEIREEKKKTREDGTKEAQKFLMTWLIEDESLYGKIKEYIGPDDFVDEIFHSVAEMLFRQLEEGNVNPARILSSFTEEDKRRQVADLFYSSLGNGLNAQEMEKALNDTVIRIKRHSLEEKSKTVTDMKVLQAIIKEQQQIQKIHISLN